MTFEEFNQEVINEADKRPSYIRKGQAVFNYIDAKYKVARIAQFSYHVDCFHRDDLIDEFIKLCYNILRDSCEKKN